MTVVSYQDLPLAERGRSWDGPAAKKRIKDWATSDGETDWKKYRRGFLWYDPEKAETEGGHKMPIADVLDGELIAVFKGVQAAASVLQGGRGGADIPDTEVPKCKGHLDKYYAKARNEFSDDSIKAPWDKEEKAARLPEPPTRGLRAEFDLRDVEIRETEDESDGSCEFEGYAIRWDEETEIFSWFFSFTERFRRGAFKKTIAERGPDGNRQIKFLRQHNSRQAVAAKILELKEDATGLWFRARTIATAVGKDLAVELREGVVDTLSIGFDAILEEYDKEKNLRTVIEARLFEISAVLWPAYSGATVEAVRNEQLGREIQAFPAFIAELEARLEARAEEGLSEESVAALRDARDRLDALIPDDERLNDELFNEEPCAGDDSEDDGSNQDSPEDSERDATLELELALRERSLTI